MAQLAEVVRRVGAAYLARLGNRVLPAQRRAMRDIAACRTAELGGRLEACDTCRHRRFRYHSCRNRSCPVCQHDRAKRWVERQRALQLPCPHYLVTFTLPAELRALARSFQRFVYDVLIREAAGAVLTLASDPRWVGGRPAILAVLHTWSRDLAFHPHVHLLVSAGGLGPDGSSWVKPASPAFLVPGFALEKLFRARVNHALSEAGFYLPQPKGKRWVVHVKAVGCGDKALRYLGRYLLRVAIADSSVENVDDGSTTFRFRDSTSGQTQRMTLASEAFLARFLQHVLPSGFVKVRAYGLWSSASRQKLDCARSILVARRDALGCSTYPIVVSPEPEPAPEPAHQCPVCLVGRMVVVEVVPPFARPPP